MYPLLLLCSFGLGPSWSTRWRPLGWRVLQLINPYCLGSLLLDECVLNSQIGIIVWAHRLHIRQASPSPRRRSSSRGEGSSAAAVSRSPSPAPIPVPPPRLPSLLTAQEWTALVERRRAHIASLIAAADGVLAAVEEQGGMILRRSNSPDRAESPPPRLDTPDWEQGSHEGESF